MFNNKVSILLFSLLSIPIFAANALSELQINSIHCMHVNGFGVISEEVDLVMNKFSADMATGKPIVGNIEVEFARSKGSARPLYATFDSSAYSFAFKTLDLYSKNENNRVGISFRSNFPNKIDLDDFKGDIFAREAIYPQAIRQKLHDYQALVQNIETLERAEKLRKEILWDDHYKVAADLAPKDHDDAHMKALKTNAARLMPKANSVLNVGNQIYLCTADLSYKVSAYKTVD